MYDLTIPVQFEKQQLEFPARTLNYGYVIKIEVDVNDVLIQFERDDEQNWRAVMSYEDVMNNKQINPALVRAIAEVIEELMK